MNQITNTDTIQMKIFEITQQVKVFVDLDGVLADFGKAVKEKILPDFIEGATDTNKQADRDMWKGISKYQKRGGRFWLELDPMPDAHQLWNYVQQFNPEILTAAGIPYYNATPQKHEWVARHISPTVRVNVVEKSREKAQFAQPGFILIDDKAKSIDPWIAAGGVGILHTSAAATIARMEELL